jgi:hypothetical protein
MGECQNCGVNKLQICLSELVSNVNYKVLWKCFETRIVGQEEDEQPRKWIKEVLKDTSTVNFLTYLKSNMQKLIKHNFVACWQDAQCRVTMGDLQEDV